MAKRKQNADGLIWMREEFNPSALVTVTLNSGRIKTFLGSALNAIRRQQLAWYQAEATFRNGKFYGPTGRHRPKNTIMFIAL